MNLVCHTYRNYVRVDIKSSVFMIDPYANIHQLLAILTSSLKTYIIESMCDLSNERKVCIAV